MRSKKKTFWVVNFTVLALFSFYTVGGLMGLGTNQAYAATMKKDGFHKKSKHFVVVDKDKEDKDESSGSINTEQEICTLTSTQAAELDAFFKVKIYDIDVEDDSSVQLASVQGKNLKKQQLLEFLQASDESLDCQVVGVHHIFFLPVIPQIS